MPNPIPPFVECPIKTAYETGEWLRKWFDYIATHTNPDNPVPDFRNLLYQEPQWLNENGKYGP